MEVAESISLRSQSRPIFSVTGSWIAFITPDNLVWRPDASLIGHVVDNNIFSQSGTYLGTVTDNVLTWLDVFSDRTNLRPDAPIDFPGYPGLPEPSLIRPLQPGETLEAKLLV